MLDPSLWILVAAAAALFAQRVSVRRGSPLPAIVYRWLRWLIFSGASAYLVTALGWSSRSFWVLFLAFFLFWFLLETLYNWVAIQALNHSPLPLFPRFTANQSGEEWPTQPQLLKLREWLRREGFTRVQALRAEIGGGIFLRVSVYQDASREVRLQVSFVPQNSGNIAVYYSLSSQTESGLRYVTDNLYLPFGGFYPENWLVVRRPLARSIFRLVALHRGRLAKASETVIPWESEPLQDLNQQQHLLDQVNTELGFLFPYEKRDEFGKMTYEGRYRVWKEIWLLNYLGRSVKH